MSDDHTPSEPAPLAPASATPDTIVAGAMVRRSARRWRLIAFVALAALVIVGLARFVPAPASNQPYVARVLVEGVIMHDPARLDALKALGDNDRVEGVLIAINSPGGSTVGGEELYEAISALRAKKPVVVTINELGASAAYMTAIAADRIFVRRLSMVGSIGVIYQHVNAGRLLDTIGVGMDKIVTGPLKGEPGYDGPIKPEVRAAMQTLVDDSFAWFVDIVAERRKLERSRALSLSNGGVMTGRMGIEAGLVDAIGGEQDAMDWLRAEKNVGADAKALTVYPRPRDGMERLADLLGSSARTAIGLGADGPILLDGLVSLWHAAGQ